LGKIRGNAPELEDGNISVIKAAGGFLCYSRGSRNGETLLITAVNLEKDSKKISLPEGYEITEILIGASQGQTEKNRLTIAPDSASLIRASRRSEARD
jgi:hypothetical protein